MPSYFTQPTNLVRTRHLNAASSALRRFLQTTRVVASQLEPIPPVGGDVNILDVVVVVVC